MQRTLTVVTLFIAITALASPPLGMRVEVQAVSHDASGTRVDVVAQLAPEDRGRIGIEARMRVRLQQAEKPVAHVLRDVDVDPSGQARASFSWPPGRYTIEVTLEALRGDSGGLWAGTIEVPDLQGDAPAKASAVIAVGSPKPPEEPVQNTPQEVPTPVPPQPKVAETAVAATALAAATEAPLPESVSDEPKPTQATAVQDVPTNTPVTTTPLEIVDHGADVLVAEPVNADCQSGLPVQMVIALDVTAEESSRASSIATALEHRALADGGRSAAFTSDDAAIANAPGIMRAALYSSVTTHFGAPLVLITDGRRPASKEAWKEALTAARSGGVPVLALGLWSSEFPKGVQNKLRKIASESGGRVFFLQGTDSSSTVVALYEEIRKANAD